MHTKIIQKPKKAIFRPDLLPSPLDTLVQLPHKEPVRIPADTSKDVKRRALRAIRTGKMIYPLIDLHSPLENQYWSSYHCCRELKQEGQYLTAKYCNKRWCFECNAIRAAKMINGYKPVFDKWPGVQFVTLTRPNVSGEDLLKEVEDLVHTFELCRRYLREQLKVNIRGLRKLEVTYNNRMKSFHPHFHLIVDNIQTANLIVDEWLHRNPSAVSDAQHIRKADQGSYIEMFKYATKEVIKPQTSAHVLDLIFQSISGKRIYQAFGIEKYVSEDVDELVQQAYGMIEPSVYKVWRLDDVQEDWISIYGEHLQKAVQGILEPANSS